MRLFRQMPRRHLPLRKSRARQRRAIPPPGPPAVRRRRRLHSLPPSPRRAPRRRRARACRPFQPAGLLTLCHDRCRLPVRRNPIRRPQEAQRIPSYSQRRSSPARSDTTEFTAAGVLLRDLKCGAGPRRIDRVSCREQGGSHCEGRHERESRKFHCRAPGLRMRLKGLRRQQMGRLRAHSRPTP